MELSQILPVLITGDIPRIVTDSAHPTSPVFVLDLGLIIPLMLLSAAWLRRSRPWGYVVAPIMLVKGIAVGLGLLAANVFAVAGEGTSDGVLNVLWAAIAGGSGWMLWRYVRHMHPGR